MANQTQTRRVIAIHAPPQPRCFDERRKWLTYLESAQTSRKSGRKPFVGEQYQTDFNFCADCDPAWRAQMKAQRRCAPATFTAIAVQHAADQSSTNRQDATA